MHIIYIMFLSRFLRSSREKFDCFQIHHKKSYTIPSRYNALESTEENPHYSGRVLTGADPFYTLLRLDLSKIACI